MKFLVISDIHGSAESLKTVLSNFTDFNNIIICGDYLNHGPRNPLPEGWNPKETANILNSIKDKIICVRGNCDSEVDEMVLEFPCLSSYTNLFVKNRRFFVTHGHLYSKEKLDSWLPKNTIVVSGHTHITVLEKNEKLVYFNPGSISLPKCEDGKTCGLIEIDEDTSAVKLSIFTIEGKLIKSLEV